MEPRESSSVNVSISGDVTTGAGEVATSRMFPGDRLWHVGQLEVGGRERILAHDGGALKARLLPSDLEAVVRVE